jgi:hypothetical protein
MSQGRGLGPKNLKTERGGSVSGMPWQTAVQGDGGRCWGSVDNMVVMVGLGVHKCEPGEGWGLKTQKPSVVARFRVCCGKQQCRVMGGGAGEVWIMWC